MLPCPAAHCTDVLYAVPFDANYDPGKAPYAVYKKGRSVCVEWPALGHANSIPSPDDPSGTPTSSLVLQRAATRHRLPWVPLQGPFKMVLLGQKCFDILQGGAACHPCQSNHIPCQAFARRCLSLSLGVDAKEANGMHSE